MAVVALSRTAGSEGDRIGKLLAEQMNYRLVVRDDIEAQARTLAEKIPDALIREIEMKKPSLWERLNEERRRYAVIIRDILAQQALQGNSVIVGHGASVLLGGISHVVRVLITAPIEVRARRVAETDKISYDVALHAVRRDDEERNGYIQNLYRTKFTEPVLYDVTVNSERMTVPTAIEVLAQAVQAEQFRPSATSNQALQDLALACRIEARLATDQNLGYTNIRANVKGGEVTLSGAIWAEEEEELVEQTVNTMEGVRKVTSQLRREVPPLWF